MVVVVVAGSSTDMAGLLVTALGVVHCVECNSQGMLCCCLPACLHCITLQCSAMQCARQPSTTACKSGHQCVWSPWLVIVLTVVGHVASAVKRVADGLCVTLQQDEGCMLCGCGCALA
jgi:hypothetical protein